jgi:hypothetical protein
MSKKTTTLPRQKKQPQRTCVICRSTTNKRELVRLVRTPDAGVQIDPSGKKNGRGAYVCRHLACWQEVGAASAEKALERAYSQLENALRTQLTPEDKERIRMGILDSV